MVVTYLQFQIQVCFLATYGQLVSPRIGLTVVNSRKGNVFYPVTVNFDPCPWPSNMT